MLTFTLLQQEAQRLARDPFLADRFREAIDKADSEQLRHFELVRFLDRLQLSPLERVSLASAMLSATNRRDLVQQASSVIRVHFDQARANFMNIPMFESGDLNPQQAAKLLSNLLCETPSEQPVLDPTQRQHLITSMQAKYGQEFIVPVLKQVLPRISLPQGTTLAQALTQLGPELTTDKEIVRAMFARFGITDSNPPTDLQVLEVINRLAKYAIEGNAMPDIRGAVKAFNSYVCSQYYLSAIEKKI